MQDKGSANLHGKMKRQFELIMTALHLLTMTPLTDAHARAPSPFAEVTSKDFLCWVDRLSLLGLLDARGSFVDDISSTEYVKCHYNFIIPREVVCHHQLLRRGDNDVVATCYAVI